MGLRGMVSRALGPAVFDESDVARRLLPKTGVMVDVGAHYGSTLLPFAHAGWQVYAFEPDPANRARLLINTARLPNVCVDSRAIAARDGEELDLFVSEVSSGISSLRPFHPSHRPGVKVRTTRLDTFLAELALDDVTFLKTDTEGFDLPVLRTFPWDRIKPRVVMAEFEDRKTEPLGYRYEDLADFLADQGYAVFASEWYPVVEYGRHHRWRTFRRYPAPLVDRKGWGNLLAVTSDLAPHANSGLSRASTRLRIRELIKAVLLRRPP